MSAPKVLVLTTSNAERLQRIRRAIEGLAGLGYLIDIASPYSYGQLPVVRQALFNPLAAVPERSPRLRLHRLTSGLLSALPLPPRLRVHFLEMQNHLSGLVPLIAAVRYDIFLVEEVELLPFALTVAKELGAKVIVDLRDFNWKGRLISPRDMLVRNRQRFLYRAFLKRADLVFTVSEGQQSALRGLLQVDSTVVLSTPWRETRDSNATDSERIRLVHHGKAERLRGLELLISAMEYADRRYELHMYLVSSDRKYYHKLRRQAADFSNVHFHEPVEPADIISTLAAYDMGVMFFPPNTLNLETALPNKLFEFVQARLGVICGPARDAAKIVSTFGLGLVTNNFSAYALAAALNKLTPVEINEYKHQATRAAQVLCFEEQLKILQSSIEKQYRIRPTARGCDLNVSS